MGKDRRIEPFRQHLIPFPPLTRNASITAKTDRFGKLEPPLRSLTPVAAGTTEPFRFFRVGSAEGLDW